MEQHQFYNSVVNSFEKFLDEVLIISNEYNNNPDEYDGEEFYNEVRHDKIVNEENVIVDNEEIKTEPEIIQVISEFKEIDNIATVAKSEDPDKGEISEKVPPFINFVTFNRLGLTIKNLTNILDSDEDFEMHIIDCNSKDNSWDYIQSLTDERIKSKTRFKNNLGPIYPLNYALTKRKPNQYFITIDSDTFIKTKNWIQRFMEVFEAFPEVGVLGVTRDNPYPRFMPAIIPRAKGDVGYLELKNAALGGIMDFIPGQLQMLSPELINEIGYWSEETGYGDAELSPRVKHYTNFTVGFVTTVEIDMTQQIGCDVCMGKEFCKLSRSVATCYTLSKKSNQNESFARKFNWKYLEIFKELEEGKRTAYCASIHDPASMIDHPYHKDWATENFDHYMKNSN